MEDKDFLQFIERVKKRTGIDLAQYKEAQMKRRLTSLREKRGFHSFETFFQALVKEPALYHEFLDRITINVSEFFRNPARWDVLTNKIIPELMKETRKLKIWSAACSTGEEPYTLAMILSRFYPLHEIKILATDIDDGAIDKAKNGIYVERAVQDVPKDLLHKYFVKEQFHYRISQEVKNCVQFKRHNLLSDPFDTNFDLIVCRNVMIYFTEEAKSQLYHKFNKALRKGGVLFVGSTEQIFHPRKYGFDTMDTFFYRKIGE
ncbi:protein-glutamate O-methyltransferase CheR [Microaerobacter geothermalis]|uniref:CheR family methyltransferase n=1 Tax=Microaerobacter geothermalis TaxID=674972 RepID=UPI001F2C0552|nr:protein-glutamate O-methyltransferase CheR [Microaerobacter geothermalis]MCF6093384.1 protein-glutamate O-methyltransferase CheR [Microaerobacter geothermalis]